MQVLRGLVWLSRMLGWEPAEMASRTPLSNYSKIAADRTLTISSGSESKVGHNKRRIQRNIKPNVTKGRGCKRIRGRPSKREPKTSRSTLVTLRAGQEEEEDDAEEFDFTKGETCHLAPEEVNKAPVFVPLGLRSPEPVSAQIEETMEEFEITVNVPDMECIVVVEPQLPNTDVTAQEMKQEENANAPSLVSLQFNDFFLKFPFAFKCLDAYTNTL
ncbi:transcription factor TFIIIB component B'' homolog [Ochotona princeps]|uniref:transcription factor TFIIIB component B'' homolog n=1 Tax=Ochotona princeps TaxID=9978 RepID=UPI002714A8B8|nr:transcription factor TFIIIB component B'' homolog [Ochotona princeps]